MRQSAEDNEKNIWNQLDESKRELQTLHAAYSTELKHAADECNTVTSNHANVQHRARHELDHKMNIIHECEQQIQLLQLNAKRVLDEHHSTQAQQHAYMVDAERKNQQEVAHYRQEEYNAQEEIASLRRSQLGAQATVQSTMSLSLIHI